MFPIQIALPTRYPAFVTYALIAVNCLVFFFQISLPPGAQAAFVSQFGLIPARYLGTLPYGGTSEGLIDYLPFVSNMFLHGGWLHLILNMWTLWLFGPAIEDRLGPGRYLVFYFVCGLLASFTHAALNLTSTIPAIGASGAISGVLGSFMLMFPLARLVIMIPILFFPLFFEVPALFFAGFWFLTQLMAGTVELFAPSGGGESHGGRTSAASSPASRSLPCCIDRSGATEPTMPTKASSGSTPRVDEETVPDRRQPCL